MGSIDMRSKKFPVFPPDPYFCEGGTLPKVVSERRQLSRASIFRVLQNTLLPAGPEFWRLGYATRQPMTTLPHTVGLRTRRWRAMAVRRIGAKTVAHRARRGVE